MVREASTNCAPFLLKLRAELKIERSLSPYFVNVLAT